MTELMKNALEVSRGYVRSLLYVDNHVYKEPEGAERVSWVRPDVWVSACAKKGVAACLYELAKPEDRKSVEGLLSHADICVVDWKMPVSGQGNANANASLGTAKELLCAYVSKAKALPGPRLLCVLTLDDSGARNIIGDLSDCEKDRGSESAYFIKGASVKIVVVKRDPEKYAELMKIADSEAPHHFGSSEIESNADDLSDSSSSENSLAEETQDKVGVDAETQIGYLLDYLMFQYAKMHQGIVPTLLLKLLTDIRTRTPELMKWFSADLDVAYIIESALSAYPEYAPETLTKAIADAMVSSFQYQCAYEDVVGRLGEAWCRENLPSEKTKINCGGSEVEITLEDRVKWLQNGCVRFFHAKISDAGHRRAFMNDPKLRIAAAETYCSHIDGELKELQCAKYAQLCDRRQMSGGLVQSPLIRLSTGSVVCENASPAKKKFYVCLQQGCDSLRLSNDESRIFFFLALQKTQSNDGLVALHDGGKVLYLQPARKVYDIRIFKFHANATESGSCDTDVCAQKKEGVGYIFIGMKADDSPVELKWEFDLKKEIAMKIADDFAHQFSRVAVDGSEWLRLRGKDLAPLESELPIPLSNGEGEDDALIEHGELGCTESPLHQTIIK